MEILQLKYFCDAAETENFSLTAKKFGVPASDISQSIKRLERELSSPLFLRGANRVHLNERGQAFYKKTKEAISLLESAADEARDDGRSGKIKICGNCNRRIVMQAIEKFCALYPEVEVTTRYGAYSDHDDFNLIISAEPPLSPNFSGEKVITEEIRLAVSSASPLAAAERIDARLLENESFVTMDENSNLYKTTIDICSRLGFSPRLPILADDPLYVRKCVELGLGVAFTPVISWRGQISEDIVLKSVGSFHRDIYIYKNEKSYASKSVTVLLDMLRAEFRAEASK